MPDNQCEVRVQPLRIPSGWCIGWNTLFELDPTKANIQAGYFGGSTKFYAVNETLRLRVDVAWIPEDDPYGNYYLCVEYAQWERNDKGRRIKNREVNFSNSRIVHEFETRDRHELVSELEDALVAKSEWIEHS